ncbi:MAG: TonB-dependent receptor [Pseudomonadales bacterium]|nr:TonB-dependent receptor [Pseudomonadales bacterium]
MTVTAERRESTVSDTAISISAFDADFLDNFNIRNQEDLQNYIPATTIQPYDAAIRGVGRTARTLGGDPGVATYFNGVYSEDFGIASTEGGLHDLERVEVLRGPQGTLYGRNAVGGAINFVSKRPDPEEYEFEAKATVGNYGTREIYYLLSGPLIKDKLAARFVGSDRERDGYINQTTPGQPDINDYGDENYAISFEYTPTDRITLFARANERSYRRRFNGGAGTMPIVVSENGMNVRDNTNLVYGRRIVDPTQTNGFARDFFTPGAATRDYVNPITGATVTTQALRPGFDIRTPLNAPVDSDGDGVPESYTFGDASSYGLGPNYAFGHPQERLHITDRDNLTSDDLNIDSNGDFDEFFDHQAVQFNAVYDADNWQLKYIFGYTDFFYDRNTDEDKTGNGRFGSSDFYVLQENHNWQHEIQLTFDTEKLSVTTGAFVYESVINQRLDLYDPIDTQGRYTNDASYAGLTGGIDEWNDTLQLLGGHPEPLLDVYQAQRAAPADIATGTQFVLFGPMYGDTGNGLRGARNDGVSTPGTFFAWDNDIETRAYAAYFQGEYEFTEKWAVTFGLRYAKDEKQAKERLIGQQESVGLTAFALFDTASILAGAPTPTPNTAAWIAANPDGAAACGTNLLCLFNAVNGAIDPVAQLAQGGYLNPGDLGTRPGDEPIRFTGVPIAFNTYRPLQDDWDVYTYRLNLDYEPNPDTLLYLSVTSGWRSGGYNLGFASAFTPVYDEENVVAYELGYKGTLYDGRIQLNTSVYTYQYDDIHTIISQAGGLFGTTTNITNAPEAEIFGWEGDITWLAGERFTLGGNWSWTQPEFTQELPAIVDVTNPELPQSIFTAAERSFQQAEGSRLPKIPEWKVTMFGNYTWPMGDNGTVDLFSTLSWTDSFFFNAPFERALEEAPAFWRWDARASWTSASQKWEVAAFVNNILDELGVRALEVMPENENYRRNVTTTDPRVFGLSVSYRMNP